ncbi:MAG TPA: alpha/beta fold hydrolase [Thermoanaerobaculia bacterium]|nr:alpha/beta fold hydrolase [Thermoanaerobaculia bacterium]
MSGSFVPWDSQPLEAWAERHAAGRRLDLSGRRTHYLERGTGEPVVLIHGFNLDASTWIANLDALAARFRVIAPDLWGQGYSTRGPLEWGYPLFCEQILALLDALGIERASLVGHSMGGGTAARFARRHPERVAKLVLVGAAGIPEPLPLRAKLFRLPGIARFLFWLPTDVVRRRNLRDYWVHDPAVLTDEIYQSFSWPQKIVGSSDVLISILRRDFLNTLREDYEALGAHRLPTLIVWGRQDAAVPLRSGETIHRLLPGSRLEVLDGAGHLPNLDRAEAFNELVAGFLAT